MMTQNNSNKNFYSNGLSHFRVATDAVSNLLILILPFSFLCDRGRKDSNGNPEGRVFPGSEICLQRSPK